MLAYDLLMRHPDDDFKVTDPHGFVCRDEKVKIKASCCMEKLFLSTLFPNLFIFCLCKKTEFKLKIIRHA